MMKLYAEQARNGRYFLHEHPASATSWALDEVKAVADMPGIYKVVCHMCAFGMSATDDKGKGLVKKPTLFMTNSREVARKLDRKCRNLEVGSGEDHRHVQLINGRAKQAQVYPRLLCRAVCEGIFDQKKSDETTTR